MINYFNGKLITYIEGKHTKEEILEILVAFMEKNTGLIENKDEFYKQILEREAVGSTGIGMGVAVPHARSTGVKDVIVALAVLEYPVDFNSIDGELIKTIALVGAPKDKSKEYLGLLSSLSKIFRVKKNRDAIKTARDQKELVEAIMEIEAQ